MITIYYLEFTVGNGLAQVTGYESINEVGSPQAKRRKTWKMRAKHKMLSVSAW